MAVFLAAHWASPWRCGLCCDAGPPQGSFSPAIFHPSLLSFFFCLRVFPVTRVLPSTHLRAPLRLVSNEGLEGTRREGGGRLAANHHSGNLITPPASRKAFLPSRPPPSRRAVGQLPGFWQGRAHTIRYSAAAPQSKPMEVVAFQLATCFLSRGGCESLRQLIAFFMHCMHACRSSPSFHVRHSSRFQVYSFASLWDDDVPVWSLEFLYGHPGPNRGIGSVGTYL